MRDSAWAVPSVDSVTDLFNLSPDKLLTRA